MILCDKIISIHFYIYQKMASLKKIALLLHLLIINSILFAQETTSTPSAQKPPSKNKFSTDRIFIGGDIGLQFGTNTFIQIAPLIGYHLTDEFSAGISTKYIYYSIKDTYYNKSYSTNIYGGGIFTRYNILDDVFLHAEYEGLSMEVPYTPYQNRRRIVSGLFIGGGYRQWFGQNSSLNLMLLYNVIEDKYSPYQNPIIRIGFDIGL